MKWLLALLATFAALVLVECALEIRYAIDSRTWLEQHSPHYSFSLYSTAGQRVSPLPGLLELQLRAGSLYVNRPDQSTAYFHIGASGFRGEAPAPQRAGARVFVVGGSTAFGTGLDNDAQTFPAQLEARLPNTQVTNAAVIGYASGQELVGIVLEILDLKPDLVIALNGVNDAMVSDYESERSYGPGFNIVRFSGIVDTVLIGAVAPIDEMSTRITFSFTVKRASAEAFGSEEAAAAFTEKVGDAFVAEVGRQLEQDVVIWENKAHIPVPALAEGDGPVMQFRRWAEQFYVPTGATESAP